MDESKQKFKEPRRKKKNGNFAKIAKISAGIAILLGVLLSISHLTYTVFWKKSDKSDSGNEVFHHPSKY